MKFQEMVTVVAQEEISSGIFSMLLQTEKIAGEAKAGQFISLYCNDGSRILPRPISICEVDKDNKRLRIVYRVAGKGTAEFSQYGVGQTIKVLGPLGNGYTLKSDAALLIAGGIGIPPMLQTAKELKAMGVDVSVAVGYRNSDTFLVSELEKYGKVYIATEDGSVGTKGNVIDAIKANNIDAKVIYSCGPTPMLRGVKAFANEARMEAQISLEEKMACGIGACLACVCKSKEVDHHSNVNNKRICKDGPVFDANEVEL